MKFPFLLDYVFKPHQSEQYDPMEY